MDSFTRADFDFLAAWRGGPCASLFIPAHRKGEVDQDPIRLSNQLREAEGRLERDGRRRADFEAMFAPVRRLIGDQQFWQYQDNGLAVFVAPELFRSYRVPLRLPEFTSVAKRFHLKPLLPLLSPAERFYVLALTERDMRFFEGDRNGLMRMVLRNVPQRIEDAPGSDNERVREAVSTAHFGGADKDTAGTRGHQLRDQTAPEDDILWRRSALNHFLEEMDKALWQAVPDHKPPLIVAAPAEVLAAYAQLTTYPNVHDKIEGNPSELNERDLLERAWPLVEPLFEQHRRDYAARFEEMVGIGKASAQLEQVLGAAHDGRIDRLFVATDREIWGTFDPATRRISLEDGPRVDNYDLLDDIARQAFGHAAEVFAVAQAEIPQGEPLAATFRW